MHHRAVLVLASSAPVVFVGAALDVLSKVRAGCSQDGGGFGKPTSALCRTLKPTPSDIFRHYGFDLFAAGRRLAFMLLSAGEQAMNADKKERKNVMSQQTAAQSAVVSTSTLQPGSSKGWPAGVVGQLSVSNPGGVLGKFQIVLDGGAPQNLAAPPTQNFVVNLDSVKVTNTGTVPLTVTWS